MCTFLISLDLKSVLLAISSRFPTYISEPIILQIRSQLLQFICIPCFIIIDRSSIYCRIICQLKNMFRVCYNSFDANCEKKSIYLIYCFFFFTFLGSTYDGQWDAWYGPSGRDSEYRYSLSSVKESLVARAFSNSRISFPDDEVIMRLRSEATVSCQGISDAHL